MTFFALVIVLNSHVQLPQRTHEIAAMQHLIEINYLGHLSNFAVGTLLHQLIPEAYFNLKDFYVLQLIFFCSTIFALSICLSKSFKSRGSGIYIVISLAVFFFSGLTLSSNFHLINIPTYMGIGVNLLTSLFSHRSVFYLLAFVGIVFYFNKKFVWGSVFVTLATLFHPSNGASAFLIFMTYLVLSLVFEKQNLKVIKRAKAALILLIIPATLLIKVINLGYDSLDSFNLLASNKAYISAMFADEIDDFSPIFLLFQQGINPNVLSFCFTIAGLLLGLHLSKNSQAFELILIILSGLLIYVGGIIVEILYIKLGLLEYPMMFLIHSQFGYRIFPFTGIAAFLLSSFFVSELINKSKFKFNSKKILIGNSLIIFIVFALVNIFDDNFRLKENLNLLFSSSQHQEYSRTNLYDDLLKSGYTSDDVNTYFLKDCQTPKIFDQNKLQNSYVAKYDRLDSRLRIFQAVKSLKIDSLIVPPYLNCFREILGDIDIFFQEHDDGNFMLGSKKIYESFLPRMMLLNFEYSAAHPKSGGTMTIELRNAYLNLVESDFKIINNQFLSFRYILTERDHELSFKKIFEDDLWVIYDLKY